MCSRFLSSLLLLLLAAAAEAKPPLRVCADPDNLPFSNAKQQGFENKLAAMIARDLDRKLEYKWARHTGRGFIRTVLNEGQCDLLLGVPVQFQPVLTTVPYYRSGFVFVSRRDLNIASFDDPGLRRLKVAVQVLEEEYAPPAIVLGRRGMVANMVGFEGVGREAEKIISAVAKKDVDIAVVWGPLAGYFTRTRHPELRITRGPEADERVPLAFAIAMGVRKNDAQLRADVSRVLLKRQAEIERILDGYGVPRYPLHEPAERAAR